jgi:outer membrane protein OmpA-like peptidoglycan-associated protein
MKFRYFLAFLAIAGIGVGVWHFVTQQATTPEPERYELAVRHVARELKTQLIRHRRGLIASLRDARQESRGALSETAPADMASIAVVPFVDANFGEVVKVSKDIEQGISSWLVNSGDFAVSTLTPENLRDADYVLFGVLLLDDYKRKGLEAEKRYHIVASVVDHKTRMVVAQADVWVRESDLDYTPAPLYRDSPMFPRDPQLASMVAIARSEPGRHADREYYDSLETNALLAEAESYFDIREYAHARSVYRKVIARKDGKIMKAYLGLYRTDVELNDMIAAEMAFRELVSIGAASGLNTKFLFRVNSTDFVPDPELRAQYDMWTRQIGRYFNTDGRCIDVVGHSSRTGADDRNAALSLARAKLIREKIVSDFPAVAKKAKAQGKGSKENIVGSGTDDEHDALDRRVEVVVVDCATA